MVFHDDQKIPPVNKVCLLALLGGALSLARPVNAAGRSHGVYATIDADGVVHVSRAAFAGVPAFDASVRRHGARTRPTSAAVSPSDNPRRNLYTRLIARAAHESNLDPQLVHAVIQVESSYVASARSPVGAEGLMQLMPQTAKSLGVAQRINPAANIAGGTRYLATLLKRFDGDVRLAVAAYNAGEGAVRRYAAVPPYAETRAYVEKVMANYRAAKFARAGGFVQSNLAP
jgi:soluble lytic murein transglycosylase-like protein